MSVNFFLVVLSIHFTLSFALVSKNDLEKFNLRNILEKRQYNGASSQLYGASSGVKNIQKFTQKLDHFRPADKTTWQQRYFVDVSSYQEGGPIFLYVFGNEEGSYNWLRNSQIKNYATKFNALLFGLEHRFYGESRPFSNTSVENLNYLTIPQALADIAHFIEEIKKINRLSDDQKWILFGGFYGGSLAAWARLRYPHLVHGAVASSAPILAKTEVPEFFENVKNSIASHSSRCVENIALFFQEIEKVAHDELTKLFRLCHPLENNLSDFTLLKNVLVRWVIFPVLFDHSKLSVNEMCGIMNDEGYSILRRYSQLNNRYLRYDFCINVRYDDYIRSYRVVDYQKDSQTDRLWLYQQCTEFGLSATSSSTVETFGNYNPETEGLDKFCKDVFGLEFDLETIVNGVEFTNREFGGLGYNVSKVLFTYGTEDPGRSTGVYDKSAKTAYDVVLIEGTGSCSDLEVPSRFNKHLIAAFKKITDLLHSWLYTYEN